MGVNSDQLFWKLLIDPIDFLHRVIDRIGQLPVVRHGRARLWERRFAAHAKGRNVFRGVFSSFDEAARSMPRNKPIGYDNPLSAQIYADRLARILPSDYPVMFWLNHLFAAGCRTVLDVGGNVGNCYYAYSQYLTTPSSLRWVVNDVPAVLDVARRIARDKDSSEALLFADRTEDADPVDIMLVNGALQFLPVAAPALIASLKGRPKYLIINRIPLHTTDTYFTLQSIGSACCPYRVEAEKSFIDALARIGYRVVDRWRVPDLKCEIPFFPRYSVDGYSGFFFERTCVEDTHLSPSSAP